MFDLLTASPTVSTSAYAAGDCVGGLLTFTGQSMARTVSAYVQHVSVNCKSDQTAALDLILFNANPADTTFTDNEPIAVHANDWDKPFGTVNLTRWTDLGTPSVAEADSLAKPLVMRGPTLYGVLVARAAMTLASTSDLKVSVRTVVE